jgi:hypothetical protein
MIIKERNLAEHPQSGKTNEAAKVAEEQMAFYLRRAFAAADSVQIFNDLRLPLADDDAAQIDHLILHPFGFVIVESKSVTGSILINEHREWCRINGERRTGMQSPILQAERQGAGLRAALNTEAANRQSSGKRDDRLFDRIPFDVLVAIADKGMIDRRCSVPEVQKADAIPEKVREIIAGRDAERGVRGERIPSEIRTRIGRMLLALHTPLRGTRRAVAEKSSFGFNEKPAASHNRTDASSRTVQTAGPTAATEMNLRCRFCVSGALHLQYGRYGYFFRCINCTKNTPIDFTCPKCSAKARIRKDGLNFFKECQACRYASLFYMNASLIDLDDPTGEMEPGTRQ